MFGLSQASSVLPRGDECHPASMPGFLRPPKIRDSVERFGKTLDTKGTYRKAPGIFVGCQRRLSLEALGSHDLSDCELYTTCCLSDFL